MVAVSGAIPVFALKILCCIGLLYFAGMMILLSYPLTKRQVKINKWYGIRYRQAFYSEENWYQINAYGGKVIMLWGVCVAVAGILILLIPLDNTPLLLAAYLSVYATLII
ncbi:MAG: SdpI family protein, partial [Methanocella sp.]